MSKSLQQHLSDLEDVLALPDPREKLSTYHDMPYVIFLYDPADEFELRREATMLGTRLEQRGKRPPRVISLAQCLDAAMKSQRPLEEWFQAEREQGTATVVDTIHSVLSDYMPLVDLVASQLPRDGDARFDTVFIMRTGSLFPMYRTFSLLEQLKGRVDVPTVLFYPGTEVDGGLSFMGVLQPEHNYRPKIFGT